MRIEAFLRQSPVFQASRIARRMDASLNLVLQDEEVTAFEAMVLAAIFFEKRGQIKPSALAEAFETTRSNVSHCISSLEAKGLLQRKIDPVDARAYLLTLKPQGKRCALRVISALDRLQTVFENEIGKTALAEMLKSIRKLEARAATR
jgi:DNA-binding MarR family transcriptional regulator